MTFKWNPTVTALAAGIAAGLVTLLAELPDGLTASEWILAVLAFLAGAGLTTGYDSL